ncbi:c-di-GMP-binding flagellar brake protein YcgR, contains PilZNR and PilZ domains [Lentibacillus persicus]|uniref:C-di-GMP-binding flagellar brake protein YcgR, contains PilZNR and PilZ domains n=1 Tax=Lentibacillus persicus TaxID=640948 RepID=A0A1I1SW18_9BACI|nr:PilZ domain-containing protein [Lentibacillus persicus]SFD50689.1 c-di-GMP-binding flagellar brake protein YcgR, contains PilZNR and PilZ domains [Lentibacillus persicus]
MKIGTVLKLEKIEPETGYSNTYRSKIIEKEGQYLFIDLLNDNKTNKTTIFPKGTPFKISYVGRDQSVHLFNTKILRLAKGELPAIVIELPSEEKITTIQRRRFVRIDTAVDVAIHSSDISFTTVTVDVSGGGVSIILPPSYTFEIAENVEIWMVLHMQSGEINYISAKGEVVRIDDNESLRKASLKFLSISKNDQQAIIRYGFEKQLEARKKELL